jgi:hypothetical protein
MLEYPVTIAIPMEIDSGLLQEVQKSKLDVSGL